MHRFFALPPPKFTHSISRRPNIIYPPTAPNPKTPLKSSSWINLVERLFAEITRQQIRRGVFKSVAELEAAIETWLTERNAKPKPFSGPPKPISSSRRMHVPGARWGKTSRRVLNE